MRKFIALGLVFCLLLTSGCGFFRRSIIKLSEEDLKNAIVARTVAKNCLSTWSINSNFVRKALGSSIGQLPADAVTAMEEMDKLVPNKDKLTDPEVGQVLGYKALFLSKTVKYAIKQIAPQILKLLPFAVP